VRGPGRRRNHERRCSVELGADRDYLEAVIRKDAAVVDKYFHPDVEYVVNGARSKNLMRGASPYFQLCFEEIQTMFRR
jgi:hypothetical protein